MTFPRYEPPVLVSFVIPAHNEEAHLPGTIAALHAAARQCGARYEIILANDASTDRTAHIAAAAGARVIDVSRRQIAAVRNAGARAASGEALFFVDADTIVPAASLQQALQALRAGAVGGGAGVRMDGLIPIYARLLLAFTVLLFRVLRLTGGCFLFCGRAAFDAAGGWDERFFAGEEVHLARALKKHGRFVIVRDPVVTSGRKLRTHSAMEVLGVCARAVCRPSLTRSREGLDLWYAPRRPDPLGPNNPPR